MDPKDAPQPQARPEAVNPVIRHLVIAGNPVNGFRYFGPFFDTEEANQWAEVELDNDYWWVTTMEGPL